MTIHFNNASQQGGNGSKDFLKNWTAVISTYFLEHIEKGVWFRLLFFKRKAEKIFQNSFNFLIPRMFQNIRHKICCHPENNLSPCQKSSTADALCVGRKWHQQPRKWIKRSPPPRRRQLLEPSYSGRDANKTAWRETKRCNCGNSRALHNLDTTSSLLPASFPAWLTIHSSYPIFHAPLPLPECFSSSSQLIQIIFLLQDPACHFSVATLLCPTAFGTDTFHEVLFFVFLGMSPPPTPTPSRLRPIGVIPYL